MRVNMYLKIIQEIVDLLADPDIATIEINRGGFDSETTKRSGLTERVEISSYSWNEDEPRQQYLATNNSYEQ